LTEAEKEVGLLMLKGLSHKEIANIRNSSEKTVRQQAGAVYAKSGLEGKGQLSAFFLEDLMIPKNS
jgi:DNA-binding CsgD family transcriptional regulator